MKKLPKHSREIDASCDSHSLGQYQQELTIGDLDHLYEVTDWRVVLLYKQVNRRYGGFSTTSMFKALALPYLISLHSEKGLAEAICRNSALQRLCGFSPEKVPTENTFRRFKTKYARNYPELMLRVLVAMVLSGRNPNMRLPFVKEVKVEDTIVNESTYSFAFDNYHHEIRITAMNSSAMRRIQEEWRAKLKNCDVKLYKERHSEYLRVLRTKVWKNLVFPVEVFTTLNNGVEICFRIHYPRWMKDDTQVARTALKTYSGACNVLITRRNGDCEEVLLSERKEGGYGNGTYALPGGKKREKESFEQCAMRELHEETGLELIKSRPVSLFHRPDKNVWTIGVLALEYSGEPRTLEPNNHSGWTWYSLANLPEPLFRHTRETILQYSQKRYPNLTWDDLEERLKSHAKQKYSAAQLSLFNDDSI